MGNLYLLEEVSKLHQREMLKAADNDRLVKQARRAAKAEAVQSGVTPDEPRTPLRSDFDGWTWRNPLNALPFAIAALVLASVALLILA